MDWILDIAIAYSMVGVSLAARGYSHKSKSRLHVYMVWLKGNQSTKS